jgi:streptomycin 6-kinase
VGGGATLSPHRPFSWVHAGDNRRVLTATDFAAAGSADGRAWIAALPSMTRHLAHQWDFGLDDGPAWHGYNAIVVPVTRHSQPLALKLTWPPGRAQGQADALASWRGQGAVELVACDLPRGALLMERLDATRSLATIPLGEAAVIAGCLIRTLAIEAPQPFPSLEAAARQFAIALTVRQRSLADPLPQRWISLAAGLAANLAQDPARCLVHADLHYDNILASDRPGQPWVAIDPVAAVGAPERSVAELLWTRADEMAGPEAVTGVLATLVENGQLDHAKATAWGFVRSIDYWLWALESGLTVDPIRCQRVASALAPMAEQINNGPDA